MMEVLMQWKKVYPHKKLAILGENTFQREVLWSIWQAMLHVTCLLKFWIQHMGEMTITYIFFSADFYDFFVIFKAFFTTSFYGFSTWPKWPLQLLYFSVFGVAVTRYCRIDWNGTVHEMRSLFREVRDHKDDVILPYIDMCLIM